MQVQSKSSKKHTEFSFQAGAKFSRLTYTGVTFTKYIHNHWVRYIEATCDCGTVQTYPFNRILSGDTKSCGCLRKELAAEKMATHKLTNHPLYDIRQKMIGRCYNETDPGYKNYGGRGITVCDEWVESFLSFYDWCIANGYEKGLSLDRTNNGGGYSPENCKWVTRSEQNRNTRRNRYYTAFGEERCLFDWAKDDRCKVSVWGLRSRVDSPSFDGNFEKALTDGQRDRYEYQGNRKDVINLTAWGETKCMSAWLRDERCLVKLDSLRDRLAKGWDAEKSMGTPPTRTGKKTK